MKPSFVIHDITRTHHAHPELINYSDHENPQQVKEEEKFFEEFRVLIEHPQREFLIIAEKPQRCS